jgi:hypothetical protein
MNRWIDELLDFWTKALSELECLAAMIELGNEKRD